MKLTVLTGERTVVFEAERGKSLGRLFSMHGIHIPMRCGGNGTCGKCKVKLLEGRVSGAQPDSVRASVHACRAAVPTNYISSAGCEVPRDTPPENLLAVADALKEEGAN